MESLTQNKNHFRRFRCRDDITRRPSSDVIIYLILDKAKNIKCFFVFLILNYL